MAAGLRMVLGGGHTQQGSHSCFYGLPFQKIRVFDHGLSKLHRNNISAGVASSHHSTTGSLRGTIRVSKTDMLIFYAPEGTIKSEQRRVYECMIVKRFAKKISGRSVEIRWKQETK
jgi:hypothetical protein